MPRISFVDDGFTLNYIRLDLPSLWKSINHLLYVFLKLILFQQEVVLFDGDFLELSNYLLMLSLSLSQNEFFLNFYFILQGNFPIK